MIVKLLTEHHLEFLSLKGGCRGSSKSTLVKMPHCWKSHAVAQMQPINAVPQRGIPSNGHLYCLAYLNHNLIINLQTENMFKNELCIILTWDTRSERKYTVQLKIIYPSLSSAVVTVPAYVSMQYLYILATFAHLNDQVIATNYFIYIILKYLML